MNYATREFDIPKDILATPGQRFGNYFIDRIAESLLSLSIFSMLGYFTDAFSTYEWSPIAYEAMDFSELLLGIMLTLAYFFMLELTTGRTLGKFITGTAVVAKNGLRPTPKMILIRTVSRLIPFDAPSFLGSGVGWHDTIAHSRVVKKSLYDIYASQVFELEDIGKNTETN